MIVKSCSFPPQKKVFQKEKVAGLSAPRLIHYGRRCQTQMCVGETLLRTALAVKKILKRGKHMPRYWLCYHLIPRNKFQTTSAGIAAGRSATERL